MFQGGFEENDEEKTVKIEIKKQNQLRKFKEP